jgi:hypothetical protein
MHVVKASTLEAKTKARTIEAKTKARTIDAKARTFRAEAKAKDIITCPRGSLRPRPVLEDYNTEKSGNRVKTLYIVSKATSIILHTGMEASLGKE